MKFLTVCLAVLLLSSTMLAQEKTVLSIPIEDIATKDHPQITTIHTEFRIGNNARAATMIREDWTPDKVEREWRMPVISSNNKKWIFTADSPRWIEIILVVDGKFKLRKKRLLVRNYETVEF